MIQTVLDRDRKDVREVLAELALDSPECIRGRKLITALFLVSVLCGGLWLVAALTVPGGTAFSVMDRVMAGLLLIPVLLWIFKKNIQRAAMKRSLARRPAGTAKTEFREDGVRTEVPGKGSCENAWSEFESYRELKGFFCLRRRNGYTVLADEQDLSSEDLTALRKLAERKIR